ncbi:hypothetical protein JOB18_028893 [Solea senegalensis]|uniref:Uncharacterized protein n=1 Tax=Solea senegalensis TaxID=28829 RepID=A0AAV6QFS5_SOLSE|nr:hypothetical protein JOB18_028893 [Solea senegalensis]
MREEKQWRRPQDESESSDLTSPAGKRSDEEEEEEEEEEKTRGNSSTVINSEDELRGEHVQTHRRLARTRDNAEQLPFVFPALMKCCPLRTSITLENESETRRGPGGVIKPVTQFPGVRGKRETAAGFLHRAASPRTRPRDCERKPEKTQKRSIF